eukprot:TRINITY_DN2669_c0_g1_i26.p1 TRINITY_DN2669_c0_g1~~TRINITY_DN2669_c0_g1_i26.p1  ORF type:complete len:166 (+),score=11.56 TRINITY_DN2669_c0_g1_i26:358-855(+)
MVCDRILVSSLHPNTFSLPFFTVTLNLNPSHSTHHSSQTVTVHTLNTKRPRPSSVTATPFVSTILLLPTRPTILPLFILPPTLPATSSIATQTGSVTFTTTSFIIIPLFIYDPASDTTNNSWNMYSTSPKSHGAAQLSLMPNTRGTYLESQRSITRQDERKKGLD